MKLAGVMGWPVAHSLSPSLHSYWLCEHRLRGAYLALPVRRQDFSRAIEGLIATGFTGISVTLPHKEAAFALAHSLDSDAAAAGAVNQLVFAKGAIRGLNTDVWGLSESLKAAMIDVANKPVVLIGAGGAARAALVVMRKMLAAEIRVLNRTPERANALAADWAGTLADWAEAAKDVALVLNATKLGMKGEPPLALDVNDLPAEAAVCDIVYNPLETPFLAAARARGLKTVDGLGMLMHQAAPAFEAFFGVRPTVTPALRQALEETLRDG